MKEKLLLILLILFTITSNAQQCYRFVTGGSYNVLALKSDNTLWGWGANPNGELGDGTYITRSTLSQIGTETNWLAISTGSHSTIAIKTDGTLWSWGLNSAGELGDGTTVKKNNPVQIGTDNDWLSVSVKGFTSFAIKNNGTLWGWGQNNIGNVGLGYYSLNITTPTQVGTDMNWKNIYAGFDITVAIKTDNTLWAWGSNLYGKIGVGGFTGNYLSPIQIGTDTDWETVSTGNHTLALKQNGTLWAWGNNSYGELGDNTTINKDLPMQISTDTDWESIFATGYSSYGIKNNGTLYTWGGNTNYEMGNGTTTNIIVPTLINTETDWESISPNGSHVSALKTDNSIYHWGANYGIFPATISATPTQITTPCVLSTEDILIDDDVRLYPNPSTEIVKVENKSNKKIESIVFIDMIGKEVLFQYTNFDSLNIEKLKIGVYIVMINFENDLVKTVKFIKE